MKNQLQLRRQQLTSLVDLAMICAMALLVGCAAPAPKVVAPADYVFYPAAPEVPRVQHLATYANADDLKGTKEDSSALKSFLVGEDKAEDALARPYGVIMRDGKIIVADSRGPGIATFDLKARTFSLMSGAGGGRMQRPINITIDTDGTQYVTDTGRDQILVFDRNNTFQVAFGAKDQFKPVDVAIVGDRLYVADIQNHIIQVLNKRTGQVLFKFGQVEGDIAKSLHQPTNLAVGPSGDIYVVETGNFRVARFTTEGKFVRYYGEAGQSPGQFARPKGIAVDRAGRLYVGDAAFQNVQIFNDDGRILMSFGQAVGTAPGLNLPAGVSIDYDNVGYFKSFADPNFTIEHVILVASQFGPNQIDVYGFGKMKGVVYPTDPLPEVKPVK